MLVTCNSDKLGEFYQVILNGDECRLSFIEASKGQLVALTEVYVLPRMYV